MTNENKKSSRLVAPSDDDPTAETGMPEVIRHTVREYPPEIEVDEDTYDIDDLHAAPAGRSKSELKGILATQANRIDELEFEVEQLRSRRRGLEEELKAREEIANDFNSEIQQSRKRLADAENDLQQRNAEYEALLVALENANKRNESLERETTQIDEAAQENLRQLESLEQKLEDRDKHISVLRGDLNALQQLDTESARSQLTDSEQLSGLEAELASSRTELADLRAYVDRRNYEWDQIRSELAALENEVKSNAEQAEQSAQELDERNAQLVRSREQYIKVSEDLKTQRAKARKLATENRDLKQALYQDAAQEIRAFESRIAEQSGEIAATMQELRTLRADNARFEKYSDSLRIQLQDQLSISKVSVAMHHKLEAGLDIANERIRELSRQLEDEKVLNKELTDGNDALRKQFETEVRQIRFELDAAQDTLTGQETINEQLASDLIDHQGYRQALEAQLAEIEKESEKTIQDLTRQLEKARSDADDYERKLRIKDSAIADLMQELASHSSNIDFQGDLDNMLQKIDGFRPDDQDDRSQNERDRVARQLIGNADGRELRFPLFKDRLTIGRTSHNDIQLNMQYVSRRHAVIATDSGRTRVIDWGSKNGVFVNEIRVTEKILKSGDIVTIGTTDFRYEERPIR